MFDILFATCIISRIFKLVFTNACINNVLLINKVLFLIQFISQKEMWNDIFDNKLFKRGPSTSKEIQAATGLSQSTISRQIRDMGDRIVKIQFGRTVKYAATCSAFNSNDKISLSVVDSSGKNILIAYVRPLNSGGFFLEQARPDNLLFLGEQKNGVYDDLPYFLLDLKPQGFLGRQIAQKTASQCDDFPSDPRNWTSSHIGRYLISGGDDLPAPEFCLLNKLNETGIPQ